MVFLDAAFVVPPAPAPVAAPRGAPRLIIGFVVDPVRVVCGRGASQCSRACVRGETVVPAQGKLRKFFLGFMRRASARGAAFVDLTGELPGAAAVPAQAPAADGALAHALVGVRWAAAGTLPHVAILKHASPRAIAAAHVPRGVPLVDDPECERAMCG